MSLWKEFEMSLAQRWGFESEYTECRALHKSIMIETGAYQEKDCIHVNYVPPVSSLVTSQSSLHSLE